MPIINIKILSKKKTYNAKKNPMKQFFDAKKLVFQCRKKSQKTFFVLIINTHASKAIRKTEKFFFDKA